MLEIICLGALVLTTDVCPDVGVDSTTSKAIELNITTTKAYLAARPYESDYSREAEEIKERQERQERQDTYRRNSDLERNRIYRESERHDGRCVDETGRIHRNPYGECIESQNSIYRDSERSDRRRREIYRDSERDDRRRRNRIHRNPYDRR